MFLVAMRDIGGANAVIPVGKIFQALSADQVLLYAEGSAFERLKAQYPLISGDCSLEKLYEWFRQADLRLVVTTTCSPGGNIPVKLVAAAKNDWRVPVVVVQDFWGNHRKQTWEELPHIFCCQDEFARRLVLETWPHYRSEHAIVTGQPAFDRLKEVNVSRARKELRENLGLTEEWPIIHFSGQAWGMPEAILTTIEAMNLLKRKVYFILREHPRVITPQSDREKTEFPLIRKAYQEAMKGFAYGKIVDTSVLRSSDPITQGADLNMGMYPTTLIESCYLRIPCISVWVPKAADTLSMETNGSLSVFPPAELGACFKSTNAGIVATHIEAAMRGLTSDLRSAQEQHYKADGKSALRVQKAIVERLGI